MVRSSRLLKPTIEARICVACFLSLSRSICCSGALPNCRYVRRDKLVIVTMKQRSGCSGCGTPGTNNHTSPTLSPPVEAKQVLLVVVPQLGPSLPIMLSCSALCQNNHTLAKIIYTSHLCACGWAALVVLVSETHRCQPCEKQHVFYVVVTLIMRRVSWENSLRDPREVAHFCLPAHRQRWQQVAHT